MRLAQGKVHAEPDRADELLTAAQEELKLALAELRELARGIHPRSCPTAGSAPRSRRSPGARRSRCELAELPAEPLPEAIEAAAYFMVAEALTNVVKYAHASPGHRQHQPAQRPRRSSRSPTTASAAPIRAADRACAASPTASSALDGSMQLDSPAGAGTRLRAEIPV